VRELLPAGVLPKPTDPEITLLDLAIQHSGLPRMPDNFKPADPANPYADDRPTDLYAFLVKDGIEKPVNSPFLYSNLGMGLLGQALADRAGITYPELMKQQITGPLGLKDTVVDPSYSAHEIWELKRSDWISGEPPVVPANDGSNLG
jgi:D-alanyl-D-alanine-carboxypeptidase/D-alanyl-D-alanine-endopeptidase